MSVYTHAIDGLRSLVIKASSSSAVGSIKKVIPEIPNLQCDDVIIRAFTEFKTGFYMVNKHVDRSCSSFIDINSSNLRLLKNNLMSSDAFRKFYSNLQKHSSSVDHVQWYPFANKNVLPSSGIYLITANRWINSAEIMKTSGLDQELQQYDENGERKQFCTSYLVLTGKPELNQKFPIAHNARFLERLQPSTTYRTDNKKLRPGYGFIESTDVHCTSIIETNQHASLLLVVNLPIYN